MVKHPSKMKLTLKSARELKGYSVKEAANILGIRCRSLKGFEKGKSYPDIPTIKKIERLYGIGYDQIIFLR